MNQNRDRLVAGAVAGAAFIASAAHIVSVVGETNHIIFALAYPLGIDGLIYIGIRAAQSGRRWAGFFGILVGAVYSMLFNADAEGAIEMHRMLVAISMPVSMLVSFGIVHGNHGKKAPVEPVERIVEKVVQVEVPVLPELLPIVPFQPTVQTVRNASVPTGQGRKVTWDVEKAISLMDEGRTNDEIASVLGVGVKSLQRTRRVLTMVRDTTDADDLIAIRGQVSTGHVARVRAAA